MKRGLIIGKFMPVHAGHIALIRFAAERCDELIVSMSYTPADPIPANLRFDWLRELFAGEPNIKPAMVADDFDDASLPLPERTKIWAAFIRRTYPPVHILFSSEPYGEPFATNLGAENVLFDEARLKYPVSGTLVRTKPFAYWDYIPAVVRPYYVKKICFYGAESTGKSFMAERMARVYNTEFVPEVARELLTSNDFTLDDIRKIALAHYARIAQKVKTANKVLFCDTDAITTEVYSRHYLHEVPDEVYAMEKKVTYAIYLMFDIDVPWVADGLRDLGGKRKEMFGIFKSELEQRGIEYVLVQGDFEERERIVRRVVNEVLAEGGLTMHN
jgi:HTH-type transcriptional repressor of NAD biosynthesis genes